jgi:hypothetical protein
VISEPLLKIATRIPGLKKYKPIHAKVVAMALINGMNKDTKKVIFEGNEVHELGMSNT